MDPFCFASNEMIRNAIRKIFDRTLMLYFAIVLLNHICHIVENGYVGTTELCSKFVPGSYITLL